MATRGADQASRWIGLQPPLALSPIPDAVLRTEHPSPPFTVQDREVADGEPEGSGLKAAVATLVHEQAVPRLGVGKRIDSHVESIARSAQSRQARGGGARIDGV
jgi:hypothetical protein